MNELKSVFEVLKEKFPGYEERPQQAQMADEVFACFEGNKNLLVEAGTGVGKSFAYLIPAILSGEKTVVSTASIALQDQLANKDLLFLQEARMFGPRKFTFAVLKGKNNYLCLKREREYQPQIDLISHGHGKRYDKFIKWASGTKTGDKDELSFIPDFWSSVCGDSDDCNANKCPFYGECFYYINFRSLFRKDIIIVNHHLLIYDLLLDFSLLPFHKQLIIDEAHQLENVISHVLGSTLNHSRLIWLLFRLKGLNISVDHLFEPVELFFKRDDLPPWAVSPIPAMIVEELKNLKDQLALDRIVGRLETYSVPDPEDEANDKVLTTISYINSLSAVIDDFIEMADTDKVYYVTASKRFIVLKSSLVESRKTFAELINSYDSVIMTSATLTAGGGFNFIKERLGIMDEGSGTNEGIMESMIGSPFDYKRQSLLYLDKELPSPVKENIEAFQEMGLKTIEDLINASKGRALVLFTSYKHLNFVAERIDIVHPFKSQGSKPPAQLLKWFRKTSNSVLLATTTFWQGIDIKGEDLSLVIILKMPFSSPGDPVYDERCRRLGNRWFSALALPSAILLLKQGLGRLIRGVDEYGVVAILDSRLSRSSYGKTVIASLPGMDVVHSIEKVKSFFDLISEPASSSKTSVRKRNRKKHHDGEDIIVSHIVSLGNSGDPSFIPELIDFTGGENGNERKMAASALGKLAQFKPDIFKSVGALEMLLADNKPQVRQYAMIALEKIGVINRKEVERLINNPDEEDYNVTIANRLIKKEKNTS